MNKIFLTFLLFFICINVSASDFGEWTTEKKNDSNLIEEVERRYKYYNKTVVDGDYYIDGDNDIKYPLINKEDYIESEYTKWSTVKPIKVNNRVIENKTMYNYSKPLQVRYIYLYNTGDYSLKIGEFNVFINGREINYLSTCNLCNSDFYRHINDGDLFENYSQIEKGGYFLIDLISYVDIESINISIGIMDGDLIDKSYKLVFSREKDSNEYLYLLNKYNNITKEFLYNYENMNIGNIEWGPSVESEIEVKESKLCKVNTLLYYRYKDILYKYYNAIYNYSDYMLNKNEVYPFKDETKYQDYYRYKVKNTDNIDNNNDTEIKEMENLKNIIESEINELKNIIKNTKDINEYNDLIEQLNNYKIKVNSLNIEIENYKSKLEEIKEKNSQIINKYENKIFNLKLKPPTKLTYDNPVNKKNNIVYLYTLIGLIFILIVVFSIKKKQKLVLSNLYKK